MNIIVKERQVRGIPQGDSLQVYVCASLTPSPTVSHAVPQVEVAGTNIHSGNHLNVPTLSYV